MRRSVPTVIDWLYSLPDWLLLVACAAVLAGLITVLPLVTHRLPWLGPRRGEQPTSCCALQATLFTATSFVIAFTLVEAESNYRKVDALVSAEASQHQPPRPAAGALRPPRRRMQSRPHLLAYARSIVVDEWPLLAHGGGSDKTQDAFAPVSHAVCWPSSRNRAADHDLRRDAAVVRCRGRGARCG